MASTPHSSPPDSTRREGPSGPSTTGLDPHLAGMLSYLLGFFSGIFFLVVERRDAYVRFHAYQSTVASIAYFVVMTVLNFVPLIGNFLGVLVMLVGLGVWVLLMLKAFQGERYKLPVIGDLAEERAGSVGS